MSGFTPGPPPGVLTSPQGVAIVGDDLFIALPAAIVVMRNFRQAR
jgi:hypothetical protein